MNQRTRNKTIVSKKSNLTFHKLNWLEWIALIFSIWLFIYPHPYIPLFTIVLILPILGLLLNGINRPSIASLVSISKQNGKNKYDIADFIVFPGLIILFRVIYDFNFESFYSLLIVGTVGFIIFLSILFFTHKQIEESNKNKSIIYFVIIGNVFIYSYGATYAVNCIYDYSEPKIYNARVINKSIHHGRKGRVTYYLEVNAWGHHRDPESIRVSEFKFDNVEIGQTIAIDYKEGLLGIPFYYVE